jgi:excisionase family DNA binding protein
MDHGPDEVVMDYKEAAKFLGLSERTLGRYVQERRIPHVLLPRRGNRRTVIRFLRSQLLQWLGQQTVRPARSAPRSAIGSVV